MYCGLPVCLILFCAYFLDYCFYEIAETEDFAARVGDWLRVKTFFTNFALQTYK